MKEKDMLIPELPIPVHRAMVEFNAKEYAKKVVAELEWHDSREITPTLAMPCLVIVEEHLEKLNKTTWRLYNDAVRFDIRSRKWFRISMLKGNPEITDLEDEVVAWAHILSLGDIIIK